MAIVQRKPSAPSKKEVNTPHIVSPEYKSVVVDTKYIPKQSLVTFVEGSVYTTNYYSKVVNRDDAAVGHDPTQSGIHDQYILYKRLEMRLQSELNGGQNDKMEFTLKGEAIMHSGFVPNVGDMFTGDVGDGRLGVFQVDSSEQRSIYKETAYSIGFTLMYFADEEVKRYENLKKKVIQDYVYLRDRVRSGFNPYVATNEYDSLKQLEQSYKRASDNYLDWFYSKEYSVIILPGQTVPTYDPHVAELMTKLISSFENNTIREVRLLNIEDDEVLKLPTIYDALMQEDMDVLRTCCMKASLVQHTLFSANAMLEGIRYSGIKYVVYPKPRFNTIDENYNNLSKIKQTTSFSVLKDTPTIVSSVPDAAYKDTFTLYEGGPELLPIHPVLTDDYYVLSAAFYENHQTGKSALEVMVENVFQKEKNNPIHINELFKRSQYWGGLQRFYYIPLIMLLARKVISEY